MRIAMGPAGFTPEEANQLRRAMATFRHAGTIHTFEREMVERMVARGYDRGFAERCFWQIAGFGELSRATLVALAEADTFRSLGLDRRQALWAVQALKDQALPLFEHAAAGERPGSNLPPLEGDEPWLELPPMSLGEHVIEDYASLRLSLKAHPLALLRGWLAPKRVVPALGLWAAPPGRRVTVCGLVLVRQRPGSAKGVLFVTLEDETASPIPSCGPGSGWPSASARPWRRRGSSPAPVGWSGRDG